MRAAVAAAAVVLLATACTDGGASTTTATPPTTAPATTPSGPATTAPLPTTTAPPPPTTGAATTMAPPTTPATTAAPTTTTTTIPFADVRLRFEPVADGLGQPVFLTAPPGDPRLFVVDQEGRILVVTAGAAEVFLDVADLVSREREQGLLGLAFHPRYPDDPRFFVNYTDGAGRTRIVAYRVSADPDRADPASAQEVIAIPQPARNHNGGMVAFGPDGMLWVGMGDGGGSGDRFGHGQRPGTLLAAMLRLDVDGAAPYAIPADNPFAGGGGAPEVWAYGLRNPWRFAFDGGLLYVADVGQNRFEEISVVDAGDHSGLNFGWPVMEGAACFSPAEGCRTAGLVQPVHTYAHGPGCSITGGYVYRGAEVPGLQGHYLYGDFCSGEVHSLRVEGGVAVDLRNWSAEGAGTVPALTSFGVDGRGELYAVSGRGTVFRITAAG